MSTGPFISAVDLTTVVMSELGYTAGVVTARFVDEGGAFVVRMVCDNGDGAEDRFEVLDLDLSSAGDDWRRPSLGGGR